MKIKKKFNVRGCAGKLMDYLGNLAMKKMYADGFFAIGYFPLSSCKISAAMYGDVEKMLTEYALHSADLYHKAMEDDNDDLLDHKISDMRVLKFMAAIFINAVDDFESAIGHSLDEETEQSLDPGNLTSQN